MKLRAPRALLALTVLGCVLLVADAGQSQCAMCKTALTGSPEGRAMTQSLGRAILLLVAAPYVLVAAFAALLFRVRIGRFLRGLGARVLRAARPSALERAGHRPTL